MSNHAAPPLLNARKWPIHFVELIQNLHQYTHVPDKIAIGQPEYLVITKSVFNCQSLENKSTGTNDRVTEKVQD
ncbi:unnamed protein product [Cercopithifilaria johnstoni]|uniref:Uncharacterized protein n=1 Tax=Cercopithifilaria johnstoni TaxID=2874296 RepID=A0A8J2LMW9_9BILA|nr:unnamed protein product [Cercopithifilaria johnstoni]